MKGFSLRDDGIVVENYFFPKSRDPDRNPTVVEVLGPEYARQTDDVFIDHSVLDGWDVSTATRDTKTSTNFTWLRGILLVDTVAFDSRFSENLPMDKELTDRAEAIQRQIVQLRDSL